MLLVFLLLIVLASCFEHAKHASHSSPILGDDKLRRVHISRVRAIHLSHDQVSTSRKGFSVPQIECIGGKAWFDAFRVSRATCTQIDGNWTCNAEAAPGYVVRDVHVVCEGYDSPSDEYIVDGSCNMKYSLDHDESGFGAAAGWLGAKFLLLSICGCCGVATTVLFFAMVINVALKRINKRERKIYRNTNESAAYVDVMQITEDGYMII